MRILVFISVSLFICCSAFTQGIETGAWKDKKGSIEYVKYQASGNPDRILLAFYDFSAQEWTPEKWGMELIPLANKLNALLIVPRVKTLEEISKLRNIDLNQMIGDDINRPVSFMTLGGAAVGAAEMMASGYSGLIISPKIDSVFLSTRPIEVAVSVLDNELLDIANELRDSLYQSNAWVRYVETVSKHPFYVDNFINFYAQEMAWTDSVRHSLTDSLVKAQYTLNAGVTNKLPDVLRQGQKIEVELQVAQPGEYSLQIINLSAAVIYEEKRILGKGHYSFMLKTDKLDWGVYHLEVVGEDVRSRQKFMIRG